MLALVDRNFEIAANILDFTLQLIASFERLLHRDRQFLGAILGVSVRGLELAHLFHEALVLIDQAVVFLALCLDLFLPAEAHGCLFLLGPVTADNPASHSADNRCDRQQRDM